jgi:glycosyltransferase involved in cell wall biosynthesis
VKVIFLCPHSKISGGVKVIFRLAQGLAQQGIDTTVCLKKFNDTTLFWFGPVKPIFKIVEVPNPSYHTLPNADIIINYGDGDAFIPLAPKVKHVLFLQHFGVHNKGTEKYNLLYPFDGVIVTSGWLEGITRRCGQKNVYVVPPAIDSIFRPGNSLHTHIPVIGSLYHEAEFKNVSLFEHTVVALYTEKKLQVRPLLLSAKHIEKLPYLDGSGIPYSEIVNPPQAWLPQMYSSCHVWMSPATIEGFGLTTLEAMACGCPVVTLQNFGLDNYLANGKNCWIVRNKREAVEAIYSIITDPGKISPVIVQARALAASFTWEKTTAMFIQALKEILA